MAQDVNITVLPPTRKKLDGFESRSFAVRTAKVAVQLRSGPQALRSGCGPAAVRLQVMSVVEVK